ncbi:MAG: hypothetical protein WAM70_03745 [Pyrinomonadaceae bacterium]
MKKLSGMSLLALLVLGNMFSPVSAQDRWEAQVKRQLRTQAGAINEIADVEVEEAFAPFLRSMRHNQYQDITYRLVEGVVYVFTGACDEDCRDLDLALWSGSTKVKEDVLPDDKPIIVFRPAWTGTYTIRVTMANCTKAPCRYGVGVFK